MNAGDTAWLLMATALVMVMLPGLALFYGGLVRRKNVLSTIMHSFFGLALVSVVWVVVGLHARLRTDHRTATASSAASTSCSSRTSGWSRTPTTPPSIPFVLFASFQLMFAAITPALITGAFAERKRFGAFVALHRPLVGRRLRPAGPLGLGARRLAARAGCPRLRRWHRRPHQLGRLGLRRRLAHRPARRPRPRRHGAARRAHDRARRRTALVRLVRLQCRLRAGRHRARLPMPCS